uniref:hypothetical protein n=1 Tax=Alloprevotella sp. TaxID=1872471 RepID=UPI0040260852
MKKFTFLLSLLLAFVGVTASAQGLKISDAPEGENWAANTQWYLIRVALTDGYHPYAAYLNTESRNDKGLLLKDVTVPTTDKGLWCIVGNDADGYKLYNKGEGTTKVLGVGSWAKMYDVTGSEDLTKSFDFANSTATANAKCVKFHGKTDGDYWWNNSDGNGACHLSYWKDAERSTVATSGNAFYFIPVTSSENAEWETSVFWGTTKVDRFKIIPGVSEACSNELSAWDANKTKENEAAFVSKLGEYLNKTYYRITNCKDDHKVLAADNTKAACVENAQKMSNASTLWKLIPFEDRGVKLYNANVEAYLAGLVAPPSDQSNPVTPMNADKTQGGLYNISVNTNENVKGFVLRDGDNHRMNIENGGGIDYWEGQSGYYKQVTWTIEVANELEVALNTVNGKSYATTYLPVGVSAVKDAKAYVAAVPENNETVMTEAASFGAKTGVLLVSDNAAEKAVLTIGDGTSVESALSGTLLAKDITNSQTNYLVFGKNKDNANEVGFFEPSTSVTSIPANRAFFEGVASAAIALNFGGNVTAIDQVVNNANVNAPIFDLTGRRVVKAVKGGLYIQNGKKYIVK